MRNQLIALVLALPLALAFGGCSSGSVEDDGDDDSVTEELQKACAFKAGSLPKDTLKRVPKDIPIEHVIIVMQENRSFDHMFGSLRLEGHPVDGIPDGFVNKDKAGHAVHFGHRTDTCLDANSPHDEESIESSIDGDKMSSFVENAATKTSNGHYVMSYYTQKELPFYHWLAKEYAISDRYFSAMLGPTWPNRDFMYAATSNGIADGGHTLKGVQTIYDELDHAKVSWGVYSSGKPRQECMGWNRGHRGVHDESDFFDALKDDKLPHVVFIDPGAHEDEHPPHDVQGGERFAKRIYDALRNSRAWKSSALFITYDEGGGLADHVSPPDACAPRAGLPKVFNRLGERVPVTLVSPYAKRGFVSHKTHSHTSLLRFVETVFDLPALTARDANSDAMLDMFDFSRAQGGPAGPSAGHGACKHDPEEEGTLEAVANEADKIFHKVF